MPQEPSAAQPWRYPPPWICGASPPWRSCAGVECSPCRSRGAAVPPPWRPHLAAVDPLLAVEVRRLRGLPPGLAPAAAAGSRTPRLASQPPPGLAAAAHRAAPLAPASARRGTPPPTPARPHRHLPTLVVPSSSRRSSPDPSPSRRSSSSSRRGRCRPPEAPSARPRSRLRCAPSGPRAPSGRSNEGSDAHPGKEEEGKVERR